ncbi:hypothetical protein [Alkaliphilus metalliredigens]|uniref:hypothetical protein n=1 Tax=Alkaliphilus metalliredigens TaxID=208226 RepID=UPI0012EECC6E|nr:hypothetical protein [Alkaliphilus metalliredigens]
MRIDKNKFYALTCKKCIQHDSCYGSKMMTCARMRTFNREEFERMTKGESDEKNN